ncbi:MAG TPA: fibronectin type III domain-containing protein, partial [Spirochaetota bacterium]|nr:fibronectin type III domain-containing protein [Spirochaetota bacterium]
LPERVEGFYAENRGADFITLTWVSNRQADGYLLYMDTEPVLPAQPWCSLPLAVFITDITNLSSNTTYYFWLTATNNYGSSVPAQTAEVTLAEPTNQDNTNGTVTSNDIFISIDPPWPAMEHNKHKAILENSCLKYKQDDHFSLAYAYTPGEVINVTLTTIDGTVVHTCNALRQPAAGYYIKQFPVRDSKGRLLAPGKYMVNVSTPAARNIRLLLLIKK